MIGHLSIYKFPILHLGEKAIELRAYARILSVQIQGDTVVMWAVVNPNEEKRMRVIYVALTGEELPAEVALTHLATVQRHDGIVVHVFAPLLLNINRQLQPLIQAGCRFHAFGMKTEGLSAAFQLSGALDDMIASADSTAWSLDARRSAPLPGHTHKSCSSCMEYALKWRSDLLATTQSA